MFVFKSTARPSLKSNLLVPKTAADNLPIIGYHTSQKKEDYFDIALYGSVDLLTEDRINLQNHTPIIYYVVTNANLASYYLPWNSSKTKNIVRNYLISKDVLFRQDKQLQNISSAGNALNTSKKIKPPKNKHFKLAIPDYLPSCEYFVGLLNASWGEV